MLRKYVDDEEERYNFTWNGKGKILELTYQLLPLLLRTGSEQESEFSRKVELNIRINKLEAGI